ncbi:hypothetical protein [Bradyrhizobium ottawaense]
MSKMKEDFPERSALSMSSLRVNESDATLLQKAFALGLIAFLVNRILGSPVNDTLLFVGVIAVVLVSGTALLIFQAQREIKRLQDENSKKDTKDCG